VTPRVVNIVYLLEAGNYLQIDYTEKNYYILCPFLDNYMLPRDKVLGESMVQVLTSLKYWDDLAIARVSMD